ncbi:uncharacterized protein LOC120320994 [Drosophila yakuba]|uniref:uncharacterized protein LOC120320994 n=1 Tax=Drosophila yakuba TaxID=7245 RepID=UPI0019307D13|nr:uncharacterized protein LOC120320994 [Drosophila yakuba]
MNDVDALSRAPVKESHEMETASLKISKTIIDEADWLFAIQLQDEKIQKIIADMRAEKKSENDEYVIEQDCLYRKYDGKMLWVVPKQLRFHILHECHDKAGHMSTDKTISRILNRFWFPRMRNFVKSYIKSSVGCVMYKIPGGRQEGPFPKSSKRNEHILVLVDAFTKFTIVAVKITATKHVLDALQEVTSYVGMPDRIVTDRGTAFTSKDCKSNNVKHILNAVRTPRTSGHARRTN